MSEKLKGMRTLSDAEGDLIIRMADVGIKPDERCLAIGQTHLQTGVMCLKRAVGKPENF